MRILNYANENSFYASAKWLRLKELKLYINPLCECCIEKGLVVPAEEVHHKKPLKLFPWLALVLSNLMSLCKSCHSRETARETNEKKTLKKKGRIINKVWNV